MKLYRVRSVRFDNGERLPMLVETTSGMPLFKPTIFAISEVRGTNRMPSTIEQVLRSLLVFYMYLDKNGIDLERRLLDGRLLDLSEIESLVSYSTRPIKDIESQNDDSRGPVTAPPKIVSLEAFRQKPTVNADPEVAGGTAGVRLSYVCRYLNWLVRDRLLRLHPSASAYAVLSANCELVVETIQERFPSNTGRITLGLREGLEPETKKRLLDVIRADSPENPWKSQHVRERNALIILCFLGLGVRRGELLGIRVEDINFQAEEVFIARRPDDPEDPRLAPPATKTCDRILPLDRDLASRLRHYVLGVRANISGARNHSILFIADRSGAPLSLSALTKVFKELREAFPELPATLCSHMLRHTWNDDFSETMDTNEVDPEKEKKMRAYLMGWQMDSDMAEVYTRRHTREKAKRVSLEMQARLVNKKESLSHMGTRTAETL